MTGEMCVSTPEDRRITTFPAPYISSATPVLQTDWTPTTKTASKAAKSVLSQKIAKMIVVGDCSAGKTSLVNRFCHKVFDSNYKATIGVDFEVETFDILNVPFNLQIWDTAGQERFKCIAKAYYRGADIVVVVFSLDCPSSLGHCTNWLKNAMETNTNFPTVFLVGTKRDLLTDYSYKSIEASAIAVAKEMRAEFWATSSKTGYAVQDLFVRMAALCFDTMMAKEEKGGDVRQIGDQLDRIIPSEDLFEKKVNKCVMTPCRT